LQHRSENIFKLPQLFAFFHIVVLILLAARILFVLFRLRFGVVRAEQCEGLQCKVPSCVAGSVKEVQKNFNFVSGPTAGDSDAD